MKYIYHYHATTQKDLFQVLQTEGIITTPSPILTMTDYISIKKAIIKQMNLNHNIDDLMIKSLSLLHTE